MGKRMKNGEENEEWWKCSGKIEARRGVRVKLNRLFCF